MNARQRLGLTALLLLVASTAFAHDAYVVQFQALGGFWTDAPFRNFSMDELRFHNTGDAPASVTVLGVSNGLDASAAEPLVIGPGRTVQAPGPHWPSYTAPFTFFVLHLDVPESVVVASRLMAGLVDLNSPEAGSSLQGGIALPVFQALVPAGTPQVLLHADLSSLDGHLNLSLFNSSEVTATAIVDVLSECDDTVVGSAQYTVPANTVIQVGGLAQAICVPGTNIRSTYLIVTMDQPGFAVATAVANRNDLSMPFTVASPRGW